MMNVRLLWILLISQFSYYWMGAIAWSKGERRNYLQEDGILSDSTAVDTLLEIESLILIERTIPEGVMTISPKHSAE